MLENCPECGGQVSSDADSCPHCGYRVRGRENMVTCPSCQQEVIPVTNPHDSISRRCPLCNKRLTNQGCGMAVMVIPLVLFCIFVAISIGGCSLFGWFLKGEAGPEPEPSVPGASAPPDPAVSDSASEEN